MVAIFSPGHGQREHDGAITVVDPRGGPDDRELRHGDQPRGRLTAIRGPSPKTRSWPPQGDEIVLLDGDGADAARSIALPPEDVRPGWSATSRGRSSPRPREQVIPTAGRPEAADRHGWCWPTSTAGRNMAGVERGEIKKLLVLESLPKPINFTGGMDPLTYGGTFTLERVLGTVPVEADGSAYLEVPALRSLFFVALDENDLAVKRMQSFVTVQPGEVDRLRRLPRAADRDARCRPAACWRCAPAAQPHRADRRLPDVFDFPRDIQPILDRHCVDCHGYEKTARGGPMPGGSS